MCWDGCCACAVRQVPTNVPVLLAALASCPCRQSGGWSISRASSLRLTQRPEIEGVCVQLLSLEGAKSGGGGVEEMITIGHQRLHRVHCQPTAAIGASQDVKRFREGDPADWVIMP